MPSFKKVNPNGRPPILSDEIIQNICNAMRAGAYVETAAVVSGVSKPVMYKWMKKGHQNPKSIYGKFVDSVQKAFEECNMRDLLNIDKCAMGKDAKFLRDAEGNLVVNSKGTPVYEQFALTPDWQASAWRLERRNKVWNKSEKVEHSGPDGKPIESVTAQSTLEELQIEAKKLEKKLNELG